MHARSIAGAVGLQPRFRKDLLKISDDGARLINREIAMSQNGYAIERMQGEMGWFAHLGFQIMKPVRHLFVRKYEPHDVHERAARKAVYNEVGHTGLLKPTGKGHDTAVA